jgi:hypothetical protein
MNAGMARKAVVRLNLAMVFLHEKNERPHHLFDFGLAMVRAIAAWSRVCYIGVTFGQKGCRDRHDSFSTAGSRCLKINVPEPFSSSSSFPLCQSPFFSQLFA